MNLEYNSYSLINNDPPSTNNAHNSNGVYNNQDPALKKAYEEGYKKGYEDGKKFYNFSTKRN